MEKSLVFDRQDRLEHPSSFEQISSLRSCDLIELAAFDKMLFGADRRTVFATLLSELPNRAFVARDRTARIVGYRLPSRQNLDRGQANTPTVAEALLLTVLSKDGRRGKADGRSFIVWKRLAPLPNLFRRQRRGLYLKGLSTKEFITFCLHAAKAFVPSALCLKGEALVTIVRRHTSRIGSWSESNSQDTSFALRLQTAAHTEPYASWWKCDIGFPRLDIWNDELCPWMKSLAN